MARTKNRYRMETVEKTSLQTYRTGIYIRLSKERTETWRNKSQSLETQERLARDFAKKHGLTVVKCYTDYEYSGTTFVRPAFQEMLEDTKNGSINCILIRDLSRLGRDYIEMGKLIDKVFPFLGVRFISINDKLDTLNGLEEKKSFEVEIKNLVNDMYSKDISKKVTASHIQKASQGYFICGFAPYGYKLDRQKLGNKLIIDQAVKPVLDKVFKLFLNGNSSYKVTEWLNENMIAIPSLYRKTGRVYRDHHDTQLWTNANLRRMIKSQVYTGNLVQRKGNKNLSEDDYIYYRNAHEPYISTRDYERIVSLIAIRKIDRISEQPWTPNRYKGLIYLKGSSRQMSRQYRRANANRNTKEYYYFREYLITNTTERKSICIGETVLDRIIVTMIQTEMTRLGSIEELLKSLELKKRNYIKVIQDKVIKHRKSVIRLRMEISNHYVSYSLLRESREDYLNQKLEKNSKIETLLQEIEQCEETMRKIDEEYNRQIKWVDTLANNAKSPILTVELLNALIERIEIDVNRTISVTFLCRIGGNCDD